MVRSFFRFIFFLICVITQDGSLRAQPGLELGVQFSLQSPQFWNGGFFDAFTPKDQKIKPACGFSGRYHLNKVIFVDYLAEYSVEGGGYEMRWTDLQVIKNSVLIGFGSNYLRTNSLNFRIGLAHNSILDAVLNDQYLNSKTPVSAYFRPYSLSFPFALSYVRRFNDLYSLEASTCFQYISGPLSVMEHTSYAQIIQRFSIKLSWNITTKSEK